MSLLSDYLPQCSIVLDASALINLMATGECRRILDALGEAVLIESRTLAEIQRHPVPGKDCRAEIQGLIESQSLIETTMSSEEYLHYLALVQGPLELRLDDGESAAIAVGQRGYAVVLDENKARRIVRLSYPSLHFCSTSKLLLTAARRAGWNVDVVQKHLLAARRGARMGFPRDEADFMQQLMKGISEWS